VNVWYESAIIRNCAPEAERMNQAIFTCSCSAMSTIGSGGDSTLYNWIYGDDHDLPLACLLSTKQLVNGDQSWSRIKFSRHLSWPQTHFCSTRRFLYLQSSTFECHLCCKARELLIIFVISISKHIVGSIRYPCRQLHLLGNTNLTLLQRALLIYVLHLVA